MFLQMLMFEVGLCIDYLKWGKSLPEDDDV